MTQKCQFDEVYAEVYEVYAFWKLAQARPKLSCAILKRTISAHFAHMRFLISAHLAHNLRMLAHHKRMFCHSVHASGLWHVNGRVDWCQSINSQPYRYFLCDCDEVWSRMVENGLKSRVKLRLASKSLYNLKFWEATNFKSCESFPIKTQSSTQFFIFLFFLFTQISDLHISLTVFRFVIIDGA